MCYARVLTQGVYRNSDGTSKQMAWTMYQGLEELSGGGKGTEERMQELTELQKRSILQLSALAFLVHHLIHK